MRPRSIAFFTLCLGLWACDSTSSNVPHSLHGQILAETGAGKLAVISPEDGSYRILSIRGVMAYEPAASPDASVIAFSGYRQSQWDIYVTDADGGHLRQLTNDAAQDLTPSWSADGSRLLFTSTAVVVPARSTLVSTAADGTDRREEASDAYAGHWALDGRLAFTAVGPRACGIYLRPPLDTTPTRLDVGSNCLNTSPRWSPDAQLIAYTVDSGSVLHLALAHPDGTPVVSPLSNLTGFGRGVWSADGSQLASTRLVAAQGQPYVVDPITGDSTGLRGHGLPESAFVTDWVK